MTQPRSTVPCELLICFYVCMILAMSGCKDTGVVTPPSSPTTANEPSSIPDLEKELIKLQEIKQKLEGKKAEAEKAVAEFRLDIQSIRQELMHVDADIRDIATNNRLENIATYEIYVERITEHRTNLLASVDGITRDEKNYVGAIRAQKALGDNKAEMAQLMADLRAVQTKYRPTADQLVLDRAGVSRTEVEERKQQVWDDIERQRAVQHEREEKERTAREVKARTDQETAEAVKQKKLQADRTAAYRHNQEIWDEICEGVFVRVAELTALSARAAECFLRSPEETAARKTAPQFATTSGGHVRIEGLITDEFSLVRPTPPPDPQHYTEKTLRLDNMESLNADAAEHLVRLQVDTLSLNQLTYLEQDGRKYFFLCQAKNLELNNLPALPPELAKYLFQSKVNNLSLDGITSLSSEASDYIPNWRGQTLSLNGLATCSPAVAENLSHWKGGTLSLNGLATLTPATAKFLTRWQGQILYLKGLREAPDNVRSYFSRFKGGVYAPHVNLPNH